ncbi:alpha/beta fold hydrolase [Herbaspirillum sp. WKF16]|uniref:lipase family alpha/beta hydrolase n=1 Tax=Herbaspirillum sp. WKF16 TaxID=3028312 RepID=UPI0023A9B597|nr:alpha/beta fold hydrolase [Herbaspirillum sp. WKF16]WDZ94699.1 alpha/beta fold hydrolase [Herbaspirillum sp. WKF16]
MISRISRTLLLIQLGIAVLFCLLLRHFGWPLPLAALGGLCIVLLLRAQITANSFFLTWPYRGRTANPVDITWLQIATLFAREFRATMLCSSWAMPFLRFDQFTYPDTTSLPVLLIHGYGCNSGYWRWMSLELRAAHITHYALDMEPVFGSIDGYAPLVDAAVRRVLEETGQKKIVILAHSMGGLAARAYLRDHGSDRVAKVITLGSPHHGTAIANFGIGINCGEMNWLGRYEEGRSSEWLQKLAATEEADALANIVSIYSQHDNIISPQSSAHLEGAWNVPVIGIGHVALALEPSIQKMVIDIIHNVRE